MAFRANPIAGAVVSIISGGDISGRENPRGLSVDVFSLDDLPGDTKSDSNPFSSIPIEAPRRPEHDNFEQFELEMLPVE
jgi:hypothetical protein